MDVPARTPCRNAWHDRYAHWWTAGSSRHLLCTGLRGHRSSGALVRRDWVQAAGYCCFYQAMISQTFQPKVVIGVRQDRTHWAGILLAAKI